MSYTVIIILLVSCVVPENAISINIEKMTVSASENLSLNCCAMKTVQGLSSNLIVEWYGPDGDRFSASSLDAMVADPVVTGDKTCVELHLTPSRRNEYVCKATLLSSVMEQPLVKTAIYQGGMQLSLSFWSPFLQILFPIPAHQLAISIYGRHMKPVRLHNYTVTHVSNTLLSFRL